jgi:lipopolysaccharide export system permease protein
LSLNFLPLNTLHRHALSEILHNFLLSSVFLLALVLIGRGVQMRQLVSSLNLNAAEFALLLSYMAPTFLLIVVPLSCMLSIFLAIMRMSADRELVALKSGGVSVLQLLPAPLWFAMFCCGLTMLLSLHGIAWGAAGFRSTVLHLASTKAQLNIQPGVFNQDIAGVTLFARQIDPESGELLRVIIEDTASQSGSTMTIVAPRAEIATDEKNGDLVFKLWEGRSYILRDQGGASVANFKYLEHHLNLSRLLSGFSLDEIKPREMSWRELQSNLQQSGGERLQVEVQKRWSLPAACLVLGLFAVPLACSFESSRKQLGVVLALLAFLTYYSLYSAGITLGESGRLSPIAAMWLPNALFLILGISGIWLVSREGAPDLSAFFGRMFSRRRTAVVAVIGESAESGKTSGDRIGGGTSGTDGGAQ